MSTFFFSEDTSFKLKEKNKYKSWLHAVVRGNDKKPGDLNLIFVSDRKILEINQLFLNHDYFTDIITFNYNDHDTVSGDIYISVDTVKENAKQLGIPFVKELSRVMIHGILHLVGYNDQTDEEKIIMRKQEDEMLEKMIDYGL